MISTKLLGGKLREQSPTINEITLDLFIILH